MMLGPGSESLQSARRADREALAVFANLCERSGLSARVSTTDPPVMQANEGDRLVTAYVFSFGDIRTVVTPRADGTAWPILTVDNLNGAEPGDVEDLVRERMHRRTREQVLSDRAESLGLTVTDLERIRTLLGQKLTPRLELARRGHLEQL